MSELARAGWVLAVLLLYSGLCWRSMGGRLRLGQRRHDPGSESWLVAYASQGGTSERLARQTAELLRLQQAVRLMPLNQVDDAVLRASQRALFVASTYGEGEPPDNGVGFQRRYLRAAQTLDLSHLEYAVLALGDRSYRQFCAFGRGLFSGLQALGARPLWDLVEAGAGPGMGLDAAFGSWQQRLQQLVPAAVPAGMPPVASPPAAAGVRAWRLMSRECINPGSVAAPVYRLRLCPPAGSVSWCAGDIARVHLPAGPGGQSNGPAPVREYSIASVPEERGMVLLLRQRRDAGGQLGPGSAWLSEDLAVGAEVELEIRANPACYLPSSACPLILVGSGTGLAGLRAQLVARKFAGGPTRNWLLFGERNRRHDRLLHDEIGGWQAAGLLERVDLAFSRDPDDGCYVQDLLRAAAPELLRWLDAGAAICVCGSLQGVGAGVQQLLLELLGTAAVERLKMEGRYLRDLY